MSTVSSAYIKSGMLVRNQRYQHMHQVWNENTSEQSLHTPMIDQLGCFSQVPKTNVMFNINLRRIQQLWRIPRDVTKCTIDERVQLVARDFSLPYVVKFLQSFYYAHGEGIKEAMNSQQWFIVKHYQYPHEGSIQIDQVEASEINVIGRLVRQIRISEWRLMSPPSQYLFRVQGLGFSLQLCTTVGTTLFSFKFITFRSYEILVDPVAACNLRSSVSFVSLYRLYTFIFIKMMVAQTRMHNMHYQTLNIVKQ